MMPNKVGSERDDILYFYHISRDASDEKANSFQQKGIVPSRGTGYGGQTSGFYFWTDENQAHKCFARWALEIDADWAEKTFGIDIRLKEGNALKIKVPIHRKSIQYPDFQLDNEQHPNESQGRERSIFLDFWQSQREIFSKDNRFKCGDKNIVGTSWDEDKNCPILLMETDQGIISECVDSTKAEHSFRTQAINDCFCEKHESYRENYNKLLQAIATNQAEVQINDMCLHTSKIALKYCGQETLSNLEIYRMHSNIKTGETIEGPQEIPFGENGKVLFEEKLLYSSIKRDVLPPKLPNQHSSRVIEDLSQQVLSPVLPKKSFESVGFIAMKNDKNRR